MNGLIIQWGIQTTGGVVADVKLPIEFSNVNYAVMLTRDMGTAVDAQNSDCRYYNKRKGYFGVYIPSNLWTYIAIGY